MRGGAELCKCIYLGTFALIGGTNKNLETLSGRACNSAYRPSIHCHHHGQGLFNDAMIYNNGPTGIGLQNANEYGTHNKICRVAHSKHSNDMPATSTY